MTQLKPFIYDPTATIPLNIAARDKDEYVVGEIMEHGRNDEGAYIWRVRWDGYGEEEDTWEAFETLRDVEKFHTYCQRFPNLHRFIPPGLRR